MQKRRGGFSDSQKGGVGGGGEERQKEKQIEKRRNDGWGMCVKACSKLQSNKWSGVKGIKHRVHFGAFLVFLFFCF